MDNAMASHFVLLPDEVGESLMQSAHRRRIVCRINGVESRRALHGKGPGSWKLIVSQKLLAAAGAALGYPVEVVVWPDPNPTAIDLCEEFLAVLAQDPEAKASYETLTLGMQRSLAYYINGGKRSETRIRRSLEMAHRLRSEEFPRKRD